MSIAIWFMFLFINYWILTYIRVCLTIQLLVMAAYYTRAKARNEVEPEDLEQGDSAPVTTTAIASIIPVGLQVESTGKFESMATEMAGPVATHPQLLPEGGHPSVGGRGVSGSANSPLVYDVLLMSK